MEYFYIEVSLSNMHSLNITESLIYIIVKHGCAKTRVSFMIEALADSTRIHMLPMTSGWIGYALTV